LVTPRDNSDNYQNPLVSIECGGSGGDGGGDGVG